LSACKSPLGICSFEEVVQLGRSKFGDHWRATIVGECIIFSTPLDAVFPEIPYEQRFILDRDVTGEIKLTALGVFKLQE